MFKFVFEKNMARCFGSRWIDGASSVFKRRAMIIRWDLYRKRSEGKLLGNWLFSPDGLKMFLYSFLLILSHEPIIFSYCMFIRFSYRPFMSPFSIHHVISRGLRGFSSCRWTVSVIGYTTQETLKNHTGSRSGVILTGFVLFCFSYVACDGLKLGLILGRVTPVSSPYCSLPN